MTTPAAIATGEGGGAAVAERLRVHADEIAIRMTEAQFAADPSLKARFGEKGRRKCTEDAGRHIMYLASAVAQDSSALFTDYVGWAKILLARLGLSDADLATSLTLLREAVIATLPDPAGGAVARVIDAGLGALPALPSSRATFLVDEAMPYNELAQRYLAALLAGNRHAASTLILEAVAGGVGVRDIYLHVFQRTQYEIGRLWQLNDISVAQEHFCTAAAQMIMSQLYPQIFATRRANRRLVAACVGGDLHEIGVRMVADFFEMEGWDTYYLGANMPVAGILQTVIEHAPNVVAISATMTYHVAEVARVIQAIRAGETQAPRVLVGGYPFRVDPELWRSVGADGYAADAPGAVALATQLVDEVRAA